ncbi:uncharacterized protein LOC121878638 [Homarus americanus]|uniref:uncharacterized protein LOC121878638 n=1 Tax=Homarus americanus TaxID=6706 RepID=UPI001C467E37|nr:uncharacterized protein LOC121878638 [Homarus americanus]
MESTLDSSVYHQHADDGTHHRQSRPVVVGAPYILCVFVVAVILMGVGTFVTSHAYSLDKEDRVLLIVGPALLGLGGLLLLGTVLMCLVACCKNRRMREAFSDEFLNFGGSTFYGGRAFVQLEDETQLHDRSHHHHHHLRNSAVEGVTNLAGPGHNEAVMILASTVAEERDRQRKMSKKFSRNLSHDPSRHAEVPGYPQYYLSPHGQAVSPDNLEYIDHLGLNRLRRTDEYPELAEDFDLGETEETNEGLRERAYSVSVRRPMVQLGPVEHRLRRNVTFSPSSRVRLQQQQQLLFLRQQQHLQEQQYASPQRKRSSRRRKGRSSKEENAEGIMVHQLPRFNPDLLSAVGVKQNSPHLDHDLSNKGLLDHHSQAPHDDWRGNPDVTHGSLGNPRRRPSVVMGVKSIRSKHSGSAYRHHSVYASDMDLHRSSIGAGVSGENLNNSGAEQMPPRVPSPMRHYQNPALLGSDSGDRRMGSSPVLPLPRPDEGSPSSFFREDSIGGNSTPPRSSSTSPSLGRPLSNISSESCCSGCCDSGDDGPQDGQTEQGGNNTPDQDKNDLETKSQAT